MEGTGRFEVVTARRFVHRKLRRLGADPVSEKGPGRSGEGAAGGPCSSAPHRGWRCRRTRPLLLSGDGCCHFWCQAFCRCLSCSRRALQ